VLKGVGPRRAALFAKKGVQTVADLLFFTPSRYEDQTRFTTLVDVRGGDTALVKGKVVSAREVRFRRGRGSGYRILVREGAGILELLWFHYRRAHLQIVGEGAEVMAYGRVQKTAGGLRMVHPEVRRAAPGEKLEPPGIRPVYPGVEGVPEAVVRAAVGTALERYSPEIRDPVPLGILATPDLPGLADALWRVHAPPRDEDVHRLNSGQAPCQRRLLFDRFFVVLLAVGARRAARNLKEAHVCRFPERVLEEVAAGFPFEWTPDQEEAIRDIARDLSGGRAMNRLVMGDVGCGKTAVAAAAIAMCARNRIQAALMSPTRLLAEQHFETLSSLAEGLGLRPVLLTGDMPETRRWDVLDRIRSGEANPVIGTQTLVHGGPVFHRLGLVVIDEQQRFGVRDRARLAGKVENPHVLVMSATPIPRTLARWIYRDLDVSVIRGGPGGRSPVETRIVRQGDKRKLAEALARTMTQGRQVMVVCPSVAATEDSDLKNVEEMAEALERFYRGAFSIGKVHGRLPTEERTRIMEDFRKGDLQLLVSTTVIEVGVHVPNAAAMVIEHPERFGLAQLHQLRGRIGRGAAGGTCYLVPGADAPEQALRRVEALVETTDGFRIAEMDLALRGQGELTGLRQAGAGELDLEDVLTHPDLLREAGEAAERILGEDPELVSEEHALLRQCARELTAQPGRDA